MIKDIDKIIEQVKRHFPDADIWQLAVAHPGVDDDGLWFFTVPDAATGRRPAKEIQIESSTGMCPFIVEHDDMKSTSEAEIAKSVDEAVEKVCAYLASLRTRSGPNEDGGRPT